MLPEADLIAKRATLRWLAERHSTWTHQDLATALGMSRAWVGKWLQRLRQAALHDVMALHSRSRARHTPPAAIASQPAVVQRILEIRHAPPENLHRIPGPLSLTLYGKEEMQEEKEIVPTNRRQLSLEDDLVWMHPWYYGSSGTTKSSSSLKGCMGIRRKD